MGESGGQDTVYCLDARTGKTLWRYSFAHVARNYGADPNPVGTTSTPVIDRDRVFVLGREGLAVTLDTARGRLVWQRDLRRETNATLPQWGFAASPLVEGDRVIYNVGTSGIALDRVSGRVLWKSGAAPAGYATPVAHNIGGRRGVLIFSGSALFDVDPANGRMRWSHPWRTSYDVNAADPRVIGDTVFISSGYGRGGALLRVAGGRVQVVWENRVMRNHFHSSIVLGGFLYGNDQNTLKCVDVRTGNQTWQQRGGMGNGGLTAADGKLIFLTERGELVVCRADSSRYVELARARVLGGTCWPHPVLSDSQVYCKNNGGELVCLDLRGR